MFTVEEIELAHSKVKSGEDFPKYIREIKELGVIAFETWVTDNHTIYVGKDHFKTQSASKYASISIEKNSDRARFIEFLKMHQSGETDYFTFCQHCADTGIEKWIVDLVKMTCTYYNLNGEEILVEEVPTV